MKGKRPPDLVAPGGATATWLVQPNQLLGQVRVPHYTTEMAQQFVGATMDKARAAFRGKPVLWVSDSRAVRSYQPGARSVLTNWVLAHKEEVERVVIVVSPDQKLPLMGLRVTSVVAVMAKVKMSVVTSLEALRELGVEWPGPDAVGT